MKTFSLLALPALVLAPALSAAVLYQTSTGNSSLRNADYALSSQSGFRVFDDFTIASGGYIESITWRGMYYDDANPRPTAAPPPVEDVQSWQISILSDDAGQPGGQLLLLNLPAADVSSTFLGTGIFTAGDSFNASFYDYTATLPSSFLATPGTQYWFGLVGTTPDNDIRFTWRGATGGDNSSRQQTLGAGMSVLAVNSVSADRAFTLEGTVPEPSTYALLGLSLALGIARKRLA
ncbi:MAG TPA: PEP-CTERM sorting domain-containing protein [Bryobacteraceae bacterium]|nr:PEP-CTERM sorting domain-containing protein [Bryobacteraceae bacterium]